MTKTAIFTTYKRILYNSHVKRDFHLPSRGFSTKRVLLCSGKEGKAVEDSHKEAPEVERDDKYFDLTSGEILDRPKIKNPKVTARPLNFEEARDLAVKTMGQQRKFFDEKLESLKLIFGGQPDAPRTSNEEWYYKRVSFWMKRYENFIGLTEVKASQARVVECERKFIESQEMRREAQIKIADVQKRIKVTWQDLLNDTDL